MTGMHRSRGEHSVKGLMQRSKYLFARKFCHDKRVVDLGCGSGFGTDILGEVANVAVGIDSDQEILSEAKSSRRFAYFYRYDLSKPVDYLANDYDVVTSMDVVEHLQTPTPLLENAAAALRPGGLFILATPNVAKTHGTNPFHIHEYSYTELRSLLLCYFGTVIILGQQKNDRSKWVKWLRDRHLDYWRIRRLLGVPLFDELTVDHYPITGDIDRAHAFVAVCREPL